MKEERVQLLYSKSAYHTQKNNMSKEQTDEFKYPCVYTIGIKGNINLWYSNTNQNGHFGIPKVIWTNGRCSSVIIDYTGEYGLTQFACAIVDDIDKLPLIRQAMLTDKFIKLIKNNIGLDTQRYNHQLIKLFKKDFYKDFI